MMERISNIEKQKHPASTRRFEAAQLQNTLEQRGALLETSLASINNIEQRNALRSRVEKTQAILRTALAGVVFMTATTALGQEIPEDYTPEEGPVVAALKVEAQEPQAESTSEHMAVAPEKEQEEVLAAGLSLVGESLNLTALDVPSSDQGHSFRELLNKVDFTDPFLMAKVTAKLGGSIGTLGRITKSFNEHRTPSGEIDFGNTTVWAAAAMELGSRLSKFGSTALQVQTIYRTFGAFNSQPEGQSARENTKQLLGAFSILPVGNIARLANVATHVMDAQISLEKGGTLSPRMVADIIVALSPQLMIIKKALNLLEKLPSYIPPHEAPRPLTELERYSK